MPGIAGFLGSEDKALLKEMSDSLVRLDSEKIHHEFDKHFSLASVNSKIVTNNEGSIFLAFFGDIFDYIPKDRKSESRIFALKQIISDYERYGEDFLGEINGCFSFALYDSTKQKLILCRDPLGVKPLFYTIIDNSVFFSSEIKALLKNTDFKREVNFEALYYLLRFTFFPNEQTSFKDIFRVPPGSLVIYSKGQKKTVNYRKIEININENQSEEFFIKNLKLLLEDSIQLRIPEDKPVGSLLSGGMDSSTVVALLSKSTDREINTFCLGFENNQEDLKNARFVSEYFGTNHKEIIIKSDAVKLLPLLIQEIDEPLINAIPSYQAFNLAKTSVDTVYLGRGGDELFGGYPRFKFIDMVNVVYTNKILHGLVYPPSYFLNALIKAEGNLRTPSNIEWDKRKKILSTLANLSNKSLFYTSVIPSFIGEDIKKLLSTKIFNNCYKKSIEIFKPHFSGSGDFLNQALMAEIKIKLVNDILLIDDRMAVTHGVNEKIPFLDINVVDFAFTVPANLKIQGKNRKYLLRKTMAKILPKEITQRPKGGQFFMSSQGCFEEGVKDYVRNTLVESSLLKMSFFNSKRTKDYLSNIMDNPQNKSKYHYDLVMQLVGIDLWYKMYIDDQKPKQYL